LEIIPGAICRPTASAAAALDHRDALRAALDGARSVVLTGSGSSLYAGDCLALALQDALRIPVQAIGGGELLTHGGRRLPPARPCLVVSLARSGDSPESCGAVNLLLETEPQCRHLAITCNAAGRLASNYRDTPAFTSVVLDDRTNDRSLVMTSSFTSMVVAGMLLGRLNAPETYRGAVERLAEAARGIIASHADALAAAAAAKFRSAVYLGSWVRFGAAREAALKVQEMTAGNVYTFPETFLGLRHGPMSSVHEDTAIVCFLSSEKLARAYELDLIRELDRKQLGAFKVIAGERIPKDILHPGDIAIEYPTGLADSETPVLDVLVGQLLAFFRCRAEGMKPDAPSAGNVITRVVQPFRIHPQSEAEANL
jgi:tagatose-6-phosphate ketose/aldose isomerase